ncbi:MAG: hypothetical protein ABIH23_30650 [bacterium]
MEQAYRCVGARPFSTNWVAILNSRQGRYPQQGEEWIGATLSAVRQATRQGKAVLTSLGLHTWEISLWAAGVYGARAAVVLPSYEEESFGGIAHEFNLQRDRLTGFLFTTIHRPHQPKASWPDRDRLVITIADELWPISVRPGGNIERLIQQARSEGKPIVEHHRVAYEPVRGSSVQRIPESDLATWTHQTDWPYLTHWTHSFDGPWPGERKAEYYEDLCREGTGNPRSALNTLSRILTEGRIRGSSFRMPGNRRAVAFTELAPAMALQEMRYRKRFQRWSFEPYGIAMKREKLQTLGACSVVYDNSPSGAKDLFVQGQRSGKADWSGQREWRLPGDLDLTRFEPSEGLILVRNTEDKETVKEISQWPVFVLTTDNS